MVFWDRPALKQRAKAVLKHSYWMSLVAWVITYAISYIASLFATFSGYAFFPGVLLMESGQMLTGLLVFFLSILVYYGVIFAIYAFVSGVLEIGLARFFTSARYGVVKLEELFVGFKKGFYMRNVATMLKRFLFIFLWSLLCMVPGIVMMYSYFMVPYILAENPNISSKRAFEISMQTTNGEKWEMFVLDLSFLGWQLLGMLTCGIGVFFVYPYIMATKAELYGALRYKAVQTGICQKWEIGAEL